MASRHERLWGWHPKVAKADDLSLGQRAADRMKGVLATWGALFTMGFFIAGWMIVNSHLVGGHHFDPYPWILLNLCLSTLAGLQCFVLLIANKRGEEIAAQHAQHTLENTELLKNLQDRNNVLTEEIHSYLVCHCPICGAPVKPGIEACPYCHSVLHQ